ncbi:MAG: xylanase [Planctomycetaceae bacterium]|nr:xylanase [Planctomycetaceae bacterium]
MQRVVWTALTVAFVLPLQAAEPTLPLWPQAAPGETGEVGPEELLPPRGEKKVDRLANVTRPTLTLYKPTKESDTGAAVVVCPGGGYNILAYDLEGSEVCQWLNSIGVTGILLKYRVPRRKNRSKHDAPLQDAQRALSITRSRAKEWRIDPQRIGILGFSAGGHLAATTATNFDRRDYEPLDDADKISCRPDFAVLVYPAYLTEADKLAPEIRVSSKSPPVFFAHANDDRISPENSARMYLALKKAKVPAELHIYHDGGHGFGLRPTASASSTWPQSCEKWMRASGLLDKSGRD